MKRIFIVGLALLLVGILTFGAGFAMNNFSFTGFSDFEDAVDRVYESPSLPEAIEIHVGNLDVRAVPSPDERLRITYPEGASQGVEITATDGVVRAESYDRRAWYRRIINFPGPARELLLEIPQGYAGGLMVYTKSGAVNVSDVAAGVLEAQTTNGEIRLANVDTRTASLSGADDSIELCGVSVLEALSAQTKNGHLSLSQVRAGDIECESKNGRIALSDAQSAQGVRLNSRNGAISLENVAFETALEAKTRNEDVRGTILGNPADFTIRSSAHNGSTNLPENFGSGAKLLTVEVRNGSIQVEFSKE